MKIIDKVFSLVDFNIPKRNLLMFVSYYLAAKVLESEYKIPFI